MRKFQLRTPRWASDHGYVDLTVPYKIPSEEALMVAAIKQFGEADIQIVVTKKKPLRMQLWRKERECIFGATEDEQVYLD